MSLLKALPRGRTYLDTCVFIYFAEEHPHYLTTVEPIFNAIAKGKLRAVTSTLTLLEVLVIPYRRGQRAIADRYEALLTRSTGLECVELQQSLLKDAAMMRAKTGVKTPDGLQLAAAIRTRCTSFITNDRKLPQLQTLKIIHLNDP